MLHNNDTSSGAGDGNRPRSGVLLALALAVVIEFAVIGALVISIATARGEEPIVTTLSAGLGTFVMLAGLGVAIVQMIFRQ